MLKSFLVTLNKIRTFFLKIYKTIKIVTEENGSDFNEIKTVQLKITFIQRIIEFSIHTQKSQWTTKTVDRVLMIGS